MSVSFFVPGLPVPKGSARAFVVKGHAVVVQDNAAKQRPWARSIAWTAKVPCVRPLDVPVVVALAFVMPRPKAHLGAHGLRAAFGAARPATRPDLDKLVRLVLDALTGIAWADDGQVVEIHARKDYGERCGVMVTIQEATA